VAGIEPGQTGGFIGKQLGISCSAVSNSMSGIEDGWSWRPRISRKGDIEKAIGLAWPVRTYSSGNISSGKCQEFLVKVTKVATYLSQVSSDCAMPRTAVANSNLLHRA
jgi:hypothetical protein